MYTCLCDKIFPKGKTLKLKLRKFLYAFFSKTYLQFGLSIDFSVFGVPKLTYLKKKTI